MSIISGAAVIEESVTVNAPARDVWRVFAAAERWRQWAPGCLSAERLSGQPWAAGSRLRCAVQDGRHVRTYALAVADCAPEREAVLQSVAGAKWQLTFRFEADGAGTRVTCTYLRPGGGRGLFSLPMPRVVTPPRGLRETMRGWLDALKRQAEGDLTGC